MSACGAIALLTRLAPELEHTLRDPWWVIGSSALALCGVGAIEPEDLDLLTSRNDALRLAARFPDRRLPAPARDDHAQFRSEYHRFAFPEARLEAMGALEVRTSTGDWLRVELREDRRCAVGSGTVRVPTIAEQARLLRLFDRPKDRERLRLIAMALR